MTNKLLSDAVSKATTMAQDSKIFPLGVDYMTGLPLFKQVNWEDFLKQQSNTFSALGVKKEEKDNEIREEIKKMGRDITEPISVGWIYVLPRDHPEKQQLKQKMKSLAKHRGMIGEPLEFHIEKNNNLLIECQSWINQVYEKTNFNGTKRPPLYILLVGDAQQIPFELQWLLQSVAFVGRITDDILDSYIAKILRLELAKNPVPTQKAVFFAPSKDNDPTFYSNVILAAPIVTQVETLGYQVSFLPRDNEATKQQLKQHLEKASNVALVFTASHGIGGASVPLALQQQVNGAIYCNPPHNNSSPIIDELLYAASDVPPDHSKPFLEGSIFFQFACFGYRTPKQSHFSHWYNNINEYLTSQDFIAALPQKLLSHPKGPLAFIGHVDTAWLHGIVGHKMRY